MDKNLFDLYTDYLLASFGQTTATGLSQLVGGQISHDKITRMLASEKLTAKDWWRMIKAEVRKVQEPTAVLAFDDSIEEKPYTDENDIIGWHYDHSKGRTVKGINFLTAHYVTSVACLPITFQIVAKTEPYLDKHGKQKRRSPVSKNEHFRTLVTQCVKNRVPMRYVLADLWFASAENMRYLKLDLQLDFIFGSKSTAKSRSPWPTSKRASTPGSRSCLYPKVRRPLFTWSKSHLRSSWSSKSLQTKTEASACAI